MTYYLASQIASAHLENGKHDMAFRFVPSPSLLRDSL